MKKIIVLGAALAVLAGCSDSTSTEELKSTITNALLNGTWKSECIQDDSGAGYFIAIGDFKDGTLTRNATGYSDAACTANPSTYGAETLSYTIGKEVKLDGSVAGITSATEIDLVNTTIGGADKDNKEYDLFAIKDLNTLYVGDDSDPNNGTTAALRPKQLWDKKFTKQK